MAPGYFYNVHDGRHSVFFLTMFDEAVRSGALWPRWGMHHNLGYGYPTFLVQAPLALYIAELFVLIGAGLTTAVKLTWAIAVLGGAWGMYELVKHWCSPDSSFGFVARRVLPTATSGQTRLSVSSTCAVVAGLLYTYAPYHLVDIYVRGALAETLLMTWFPWVILAFDRLIAAGMGRGWQRRLLLAAVGYGSTLLTHSFALPAFTPVLAGFILFRLWLGAFVSGPAPWAYWRPTLTRTLLSLAAGVAGLLLAAVFLLPLVVEGQYLVMEDWISETYGYERHWVYWGQFFSSFWGYGYSDDPVGANDGMGFQQGAILLILAGLGAFVVANELLSAPQTDASDNAPAGTRRNARLYLMFFFLLAGIASLAATTPAAATIWRLIPLLEIIQFPWRLLAPAALALSIVGGLLVWYLGSSVQRPWADDDAQPTWSAESGMLLLGLLVVFASFSYSRPASLQPVETWREDGRAVAEFESEHPDMFGYTQYSEETLTSSPMRAQYLKALEAEQQFDNDRLTRLVVTKGEGKVTDMYSRGHAFGGTVDMETTGTVQIQLLAFPGWQVKVNGAIVEARISGPNGLMEIDVPPGTHAIDIWMGQTGTRLAGMMISGLTLLTLIALWWMGRTAGPNRTS